MIATIAIATLMTQPECTIEARHVRQSVVWMMDQGWGYRDDEKAFCVNSSTNKNARFVSVVQKIRGPFFFEFLIYRNPLYKFVVCDDGGLSKAHVEIHNSPTPLVYIITSIVANHAPSVPILKQFPSVNLAFQFSDKTLNSSYR